MYDVIVVGAGPSGMTAAICAADEKVNQAFRSVTGKTGKKSVLIIEKNKKIGNKLYATGNGRCNVSNAAFDLDCYISENEFFPFQVVGRDDYRTVNRFLELMGVPVSDEHGYFYPLSRQASSVVWGFFDRLKKNNVEIHTREIVADLKWKNGVWQVKTSDGIYEAKRIVLSCGSPAAIALGGTLCGIDMLRQLGHPIFPFRPALCKIFCEEDISALHGVRVRAEVTVWQAMKECIFKERGEVQFTEGGLSGIVMFDASCHIGAAYARAGSAEEKSIRVMISLLPELTERELLDRFEACARDNPERTATALLNGFVHEKLADYLLSRFEITKPYIKDLTEQERNALVVGMKHLEFTVTGTADYAGAQAAIGGADTRFVDPTTLKSRIADRLYIVGELLDVCGRCGGYNLTWAILTGMKAGFDIYDSDQ